MFWKLASRALSVGESGTWRSGSGGRKPVQGRTRVWKLRAVKFVDPMGASSTHNLGADSTLPHLEYVTIDSWASFLLGDFRLLGATILRLLLGSHAGLNKA